MNTPIASMYGIFIYMYHEKYLKINYVAVNIPYMDGLGTLVFNQLN